MKQQQQQQQQQQAQTTQSVTTNVHPQQIPTTPNNIDTIKQQTSSTNTTLASTITTRVKLSLFSILLINYFI